MKKFFKFAAIATSVVLLAGCMGTSVRSDSYVVKETRQLNEVQYATVVTTKAVMIEGRESGVVGTATGAILGGLIGSTLGGGTGKQIATTVGVVAGGVAGAGAEKGLTAREGEELTLRLSNGKEYVIIQEYTGSPLMAGEKVRLIKTNQGYRAMR